MKLKEHHAGQIPTALQEKQTHPGMKYLNYWKQETEVLKTAGEGKKRHYTRRNKDKC